MSCIVYLCVLCIFTLYFLSQFFTKSHTFTSLHFYQSTQEELVPLNDLLADETCDELEEEDETSGEDNYHSYMCIHIHIYIHWHHMSVVSVSNPHEGNGVSLTLFCRFSSCGVRNLL